MLDRKGSFPIAVTTDRKEEGMKRETGGLLSQTPIEKSRRYNHSKV